ncbi:MAG: glycosyltransferase family 4 protein [Chryseolinea sp.]
MPDDISIRPSLLIVSDTAIWRKGDDHLPYEPVVRELESIGNLFSRITWIGFDYGNIDKPVSARAVNGLTVNYILLKRVGGDTLWSKLVILFSLPSFLIQILNAIKSHDVIHSRGPSVPALISIVISFFKRDKIFWHKYAGNWIEEGSPYMYRLQRKLLVKADRSHVTVNGAFNNPPHILNFLNPCIYKKDYEASADAIGLKNFNSKVRICFVGNLARFKGVDLILDAVNRIADSTRLIEEVIIVGDGEARAELEYQAKSLHVPVTFKGYLKRQELDAIYRSSHLNILPSSSEGFPKVIAEGGIFGCCPIVSNLSSIGQVIHHQQNGLLLSEITADAVSDSIQFYLTLDPEKRFQLAQNIRLTSLQFSYEDFRERIRHEILKVDDVNDTFQIK